MLTRVLEPEVMDSAEEARDYDAMDHGEVNRRFCTDLLRERALPSPILDIGTGTALIPIELCRRAPDAQIVAIDLATHMLDLAGENVRRAGLADRIRLERADAKALAFPSGSFGAVISNSIVHHIPDPNGIFSEIARLVAPGGLVFLRDLMRPETDAEVDRLTELHAGAPPEEADRRASFDRQRALLHASLKAALTVDEVKDLARKHGLGAADVRATSDRHWTLVFAR